MSLLAGVGVLLLAIGVGVLIGRSGSGSGRAPAAQVVTIGGTTANGTGASEEAFTGDWPSAKKGWTVELQTLPEGTKVSAVEAAKAAASGKGATAVGALKAEEFPSVGGEGFVIYSGQYTKKAEATRAVAGLRKNFPGAKAVEVSGGGGESSGGAGSASKSGAGTKAKGSLTHPAPAQSLPKSHERSSGKKYVEESAKLPDVVSTG